MQDVLNLEVLWQDDHLVAITKPAGVVAMRAKTTPGPTIQDWFEEWSQAHPSPLMSPKASQPAWRDLVPADFSDQYGSPEEIFQQRGGVIHRLDKDTSGVMLLARHPASLVAFLRLFRERQVHKEYVCLVHGKFQVEKGTFTGPIGRASFNRQRFTVQAEGRPAQTEYQVQDFWSHLKVETILAAQPAAITNFKKRIKIYQGFSLVVCRPKTGRTHQIRVHLAAAQHPLVGDQLYAGKKRQQLDRVWCPRQFLHAQQISFEHPLTHQQLQIEATLPADLTQTLSFLEN